MATPDKPGKAMSSRLLTMKFMQRAAASPQSAPSTPDSRPAKRPRHSLPARVELNNYSSDTVSIQTALAAEELKRQRVLDRQAHDAGDTKWTLEINEESDIAPLVVKNAGYNEIDSALSITGAQGKEGMESGKISGRQRFGNYEPIAEVSWLRVLLETFAEYQDVIFQVLELLSDFPLPQKTPKKREADSDGSSEDESPSGSEGNEDSDEVDISKLTSLRGSKLSDMKVKRNFKMQDERQEHEQRSARRRQKKVKLNDMTSISSGGSKKMDSPWGNDSGMRPSGCFTCGGIGHKKVDCPRNKMRGYVRNDIK